MNPQRRSQYLKALDVDVWVLRSRDADNLSATGLNDARVAGQESVPTPPAGAAVQPPAVAAAPVSRRASPPAVKPAAKPAVAPVAELPPLTPATDWAGLRDQVLQCQRCALCETRTQAVFGVGAQSAPLMVVGEGPGADEDRLGEPFVGRAGQLLDRMLAAIQRDRQQNVYIANVVKCRPPGNRDPLEIEAEACRPYLEQQIKLVQPKLIVALGRVAAQRLLKTSEPLARLRGDLHHYGPDQTPVWVTYHPAYLLRSPRDKAKSWADLKRIRALLDADA